MPRWFGSIRHSVSDTKSDRWADGTESCQQEQRFFDNGTSVSTIMDSKSAAWLCRRSGTCPDGSLLQKHFPYFWKTREFLIFAAFSLYTPEKNQRRRAMPKKMPAARRADQWKLLRGTAKHVTIMEINYKTFAQSIGICKGEKYDGIQSASNGFG